MWKDAHGGRFYHIGCFLFIFSSMGVLMSYDVKEWFSRSFPCEGPGGVLVFLEIFFPLI